MRTIPTCIRKQIIVLGLLLLPAAVGTPLQVGVGFSEPTLEQRIAAVLVSWGRFPCDLTLPVSSARISRQLTLLRFGTSQERVRAAEWLAAHGVQDAGPVIVDAMVDSETLRPCQLAKSLGALGEERWSDVLGDAVRQDANSDLRVCAAYALGTLASPKTVDDLIEAYQQNAAPTYALSALGQIADPSSLPFLQSVAASPRSEPERWAVWLAIDRVRIMQQVDPVPSLIDRVKRSLGAGSLDAWAIRKLVETSDDRVVQYLEHLLQSDRGMKEDDYILVVAGLLAGGPAGRASLEQLSESKIASPVAARALAAAMSLLEQCRTESWKPTASAQRLNMNRIPRRSE